MANTRSSDGAGGAIAHGGRLGQARRLFPNAPEPFIDLSTGINPRSYPLPTLPPEAFTRLPEPEALDTLQSAAAHAYGVSDPSMVAAAPGTQILIDLLPRLWPMREIAVLGPTYHGVFRSIYFFDPNGHRLELACNIGTAEQYAELRALAPVMLEEWSRTKRAPRHAAWLHTDPDADHPAR